MYYNSKATFVLKSLLSNYGYDLLISEETYITHRAWDRRTLLILLYKTKVWAKIAENGRYALIGARWGETLSRHVIDFDQWEHVKI